MPRDRVRANVSIRSAAAAVLVAFLATATSVAGIATPVAADRGGVEVVALLDENEGPLVLSSDLSTLLISAWDTGDTVALDLASGDRTGLDLPTGGFNFPVAISGDGTALAVNGPWEGVESGDADGRLSDGFLYEIGSQELQLVTPGPAEIVNDIVAMATSSDTFVVRSHGLFDGPYPVFTVLDDGSSSPLDLGEGVGVFEGAMQLSADGSTLLYSRPRGQSMIWYVRDLDTGDTETRAAVRGGYGASMSADGSTVAWTEDGGEFDEFGLSSSVVAIWQVEADTLDLYELEDMSGGIPVLSADGSNVSGFSFDYGSEENDFQSSSRLWQVDVATGEVETLVSNIGFDGGAFLLGGNTDGSELVFSASGFGGLSIDPFTFNTTVYRWTADGTPAATGAPAASSLTDQVVRLYQAYFGRLPDAAGLDHWARARASGSSLAEVSSAFAASPEFQETYGSLTDAEFVALVYQNVLGRTADAGGLAYWTAQLAAGVSRGQVMVGFSESAEFIESTGTTAPMSATEGAIRRMYFAFFDREPSATELDSWTQQINAGSTLDEVATVFGQSAEFDQIYGDVEPYLIWEASIRRILGRQPTDSDYERWLAPMEQQQLTIPQFLLQLANEPVVVLETGTAPLGG